MQDLLLDNNMDLQIANGDLVIGMSDAQHKMLLLMAQPGSFKENPTVGVGIDNFLENENPADLLKAVRTQFYADGMQLDASEVTTTLTDLVNAFSY